jgi:protein-disulfide isomerase
MRSIALIAVTSVFVIGVASVARAQNQPPATQAAKPSPTELSPAQTTAIQKRVENYLRSEYAWGPAIAVKVGSLEPAPAGDLYAVTVQVAVQDQSDSTIVYVSKDGRYMFRGDMLDLNEDPFATIRRQLNLEGAPSTSKGPANAPVVLVEFGDFECPSCRELDSLLRDVLPKYPQVRLVFKDFPLEEIHPWALTAAIAGRCAFHQSPDAFWKLHDAIYDDQDLISPENAYSKLTDLATTAGVNVDQFQTCMADPKTTEEVHKSEEEGKTLQVNSTPTTFVDGRRLIGPDQQLLEQYIQFDLSAVPTLKPIPQ